MPEVTNIPQITRSLLTLADEEDFGKREWMVFKSFAGTYRIYCERSAEIVLDDLRGYVETQQLHAIQEAQGELGLEPQHRRAVLRYYRDWAYRYGAKQAEEVTQPPNEYRDKPSTTVQLHAEDLIESGEATVNDMALAFQLLDDYRREEASPPLLTFFDRVHEQVVDLVETKQPDVNWDLLGGWFDQGRRMANEATHEAIGRRQARRELINELQETDLTLDEWLAENA